MPGKKARETYFQFKKTFTSREQTEMIDLLSTEWMVDKSEVVNRIIAEGFVRERNKRRELSAIRNSGR